MRAARGCKTFARLWLAAWVGRIVGFGGMDCGCFWVVDIMSGYKYLIIMLISCIHHVDELCCTLFGSIIYYRIVNFWISLFVIFTSYVTSLCRHRKKTLIESK